MSRAARPVVWFSSLPCSSVFFALALAAAGCSQGLGERCEITDDCEAGLVCGTNGVCGRGGSMVDAAPLSDATFVSRPDTGLGQDGAVVTPDGAPTDGPMSSVDAPVLTVDAALIDAAGDAL